MLVLGPQATFGHEAAIEFNRKRNAEGKPLLEIECIAGGNEKVLAEVIRTGSWGMLPVANSTFGPVGPVISALSKGLPDSLSIVAEVVFFVRHNLLAHPSVKSISDLKGVMSHSQALGQCRLNLDTLAVTNRLEMPSTAGAAKAVASCENRHFGAIASIFAAETYGLTVLQENLHDKAGNNTRFLVVGPERARMTGRDKTVVTFIIPDESGVLAKITTLPWALGVNISSVPHTTALGENHLYFSYMELDTHRDSKEGELLLKCLRHVTKDFKVLGSFPQSE